MRAGRAVAFGAILSFAAAAPLAVDNSAKALEERGSSCPPLYIIVARGSYEPVGEGSMGPAVANVVCAKVRLTIGVSLRILALTVDRYLGAIPLVSITPQSCRTAISTSPPRPQVQTTCWS